MFRLQKELAMKVWLYQVRATINPPAEIASEVRAKKTTLEEQGIPIVLNNPKLEGLYDATVRSVFGERGFTVVETCEFSVKDVKFLGTQDFDVGGPKSFPKA
jgi:hypothetical protein